MAKLYLHIGTHKTGTSAIQSFLYKKEKELRQENLVVLKKLGSPFHLEMRECTKVSEKLIADYKDFFNTHAKRRDQNYFYSNEEFSGNPRTHYDNNRHVFEILKEAIPKDFELEIIVAYRRQDAYVQSIFTQYKHHGGKLSFRDLLKLEYFKGLDWMENSNTIQEVFGRDVKLHVLPYEPKLLEAKSMLQLLGGIIDVSFLNGVSDLPSHNVGLSKHALKFYDQIAPSLETDYQNFALIRILQKVDNKGVGKEYHYLSYEEKLAFLALYDESNRRLAAKYWKETYGLENFSPPQKKEEEINKPTEELVVKEVLGLLERQSNAIDKIKRNYIVRAINKMSRLAKRG